MLKTRVLLVDDSAAVRRAVHPLFDSHPKFQVVGEAQHGREAIEKARTLHPDLIILDLSMPVMNRLEAAPLLLKMLPNVWIILFTAHDLPEVQGLSRAAGIHAVLPKSNAAADLVTEAEALVFRAAEEQVVGVNPFPLMPTPEPMLEHAIRHRAYEHYVQRGMAHGHAVDDWLKAEAELRGHSSSDYNRT